jgi:hypothetical protein
MNYQIITMLAIPIESEPIIVILTNQMLSIMVKSLKKHLHFYHSEKID